MSNNPYQDDFLKQMSDVKPIKQDKITENSTKYDAKLNANYRQKVAQTFTQVDDNFLTDGDVDSVEPEEILSFKVDGIQPAVYKRLRQGRYDIDYHLDLHRKTVAEARQNVYGLLKNASNQNYRTLLITHGKGTLSNPPARLKSYVFHWLKQIDTVLAFHSSEPKDGGAGSVYVLLKKPVEKNKINLAKYE